MFVHIIPPCSIFLWGRSTNKQINEVIDFKYPDVLLCVCEREREKESERVSKKQDKGLKSKDGMLTLGWQRKASWKRSFVP